METSILDLFGEETRYALIVAQEKVKGFCWNVDGPIIERLAELIAMIHDLDAHGKFSANAKLHIWAAKEAIADMAIEA